MVSPGARGLRDLWPLVVLCGVVVVVTFGAARGLWASNLHNGLLALAFGAVGAYVLSQRPGHREGLLFVAAGALEALMFYGRQVGHSPSGSTGADWWAWLGVWPLVVALLLGTLAVLAFPDGRLPSPSWRPVVGVLLAVTAVCALLSALWPVEYDAAGISTVHPVNATAPDLVTTVWSALAHPAYIAFQLLWVVAVALRWRTADGHVRRQLAWVCAAAAVSVVALVAGLAGWGSPRAGILAAALVPVAAGWAIVHGQHLAAYSALTWMSRSRASDAPADLTADLARATAEALVAPGATVWMGPADDVQAVGLWPPTGASVAGGSLTALTADATLTTRPVLRGEAVIGALTVDRAVPLSIAEGRLLDDLAGQAALVIEHVSLADVIARQRLEGHLDGLSPREQEVLELMARGFSNAAICDELHLSVKTVEPVVSAIFAKLELHQDPSANRRVLAVLAYLRT